MFQEANSSESITTAPENTADVPSESVNDSESICLEFSNIKLRTCKVSELMNPSPELRKFSSQKSDFSYVCRKTGVLSYETIMALLLVCPILVSQVDNQYRILAGTRIWAIATTSLPPATKICILELKKSNEIVERRLAMVDYYVCGLFFSLSKASLKLIQSSFKHFDTTQRNDAIYMVPGIKTIDELAIATGVRTETTRKDRQAASQAATAEN